MRVRRPHRRAPATVPGFSLFRSICRLGRSLGPSGFDLLFSRQIQFYPYSFLLPQPHSFPFQRAAAPFFAISVRRLFVSFSARAGPPFFPIIEKTRLTISGVGSAWS